MGSSQSRKKIPEAKVNKIVEEEKVSYPSEIHPSYSVLQNHKQKPNSIFPLETSTLTAQESVPRSPTVINFPNNSQLNETKSQKAQNVVTNSLSDKVYNSEDINNVTSPIEKSSGGITEPIISKSKVLPDSNVSYNGDANLPNNSRSNETNIQLAQNEITNICLVKVYDSKNNNNVASHVEKSSGDITEPIISKSKVLSDSNVSNGNANEEVRKVEPIDITSSQSIKSTTNKSNIGSIITDPNAKIIASDLQFNQVEIKTSTANLKESFVPIQDSTADKSTTIESTHSVIVLPQSDTIESQDVNILNTATESNVINFLPFSTFSKHGSIPRYPNDNNLVVPMKNINFEDSLILFISHCWLRGWDGANGWDGVPHPDNPQHEKYQLIVEVVQKVWSTMAPSMKNCYLWLDYGCINQDADPAGELKQLDTIVQCCDCIITPLVDEHYRDWRLQLTQNGYFVDYKAPSWNVGNYAYLNRGWCRIEMFFAANIPVTMSPSRLEKFSTGLHSALSVGRRAHLLYGTRESVGHYGPIVLQPLVHSNFETYNPIDGYLTFESDRDKIRHLVKQLEPYMHRLEFGYIGKYNADGERHGLGSYYHENGDIYDGMFINNLRHGHGKFRYSTGAMYEGEFINDIIDNYGKFTYANGDVYVGENKKGNKHGSGQYVYANGDTYNGEYKNDMKDGYGRFAHSSGSTYEGLYHRNNRHGNGKLVLKDGSIYEGLWSFDKMDGKGMMHYSNGNKYSGDWMNNERHGRGKMTCRNCSEYDGDWWHDKMTGKGILKYPSGDLYEGDFFNGQFQGVGKLTFANSLSYFEGQFEGGMKEGTGTYRYSNGDIYTGRFKADKLNGVGVFKYANGNLYEGEFQDNKKNGNGKFSAADGHSCEGQWFNDLIHGKGKYMYANGDIYEGDFVAGKFHGVGKYTYKSGTVFEGSYENDQRHGAGKITFVNGNTTDLIYEKGVKIKK